MNLLPSYARIKKCNEDLMHDPSTAVQFDNA